MNIVSQIIDKTSNLESGCFFPGYSGNISNCSEGYLLITSSGSNISKLSKKDFVFFRCSEQSFQLKRRGGGQEPSSESPLHIKTYQKTGPGFIVHSHPEYSVVISQKRDSLKLRSEGARDLIGKEIEIIPEITAGSIDLAEEVSNYLKNNEVALVRNHGLFVKSINIERACKLTELVERNAKQIYLESVIDS
ncbi:class II aldolase/adducin family protein [Methanonatronarchaeum sp. AMET-Sl]|uniref:class II aldolase/adducin family protein n=1 Tax=Methanonatronarchaeum sp. AMET-Sl TaxID=3037654 RepID=UPI00244DEC93|nr:class II aldolase/adducin family protein [Methanonatronarchaeum sp. AMET-Sl]WGI17784.1 class II aldolase/adducin family protein [Methanonatronarchaeum sp. AMET-Sl]